MVVRVDVAPELFEWARARSGIDDETWERRFPKYESWLVRETRPTLKQLEEFARKSYAPVGFFFLPEPPMEKVPIPDFRTIGDQPVGESGSVGVAADLLDTIYVCQARQEWYRDSQLMNGEPPLEFVGTADIDTPVLEATERMRTVLDWTSNTRSRLRSWADALTALRENAEAAGVLVMISGKVGDNTHRILDPEEFRGFALVDEYASVVFVNGADSKAAQVFTLAHELAHIWLGESALSDLEPESTRSIETERWCNQVAAEFLVPMEEFRAVMRTSGDVRAQLQPLAEYFRVSTQVILGRFREAGVLSWSQYMDELEIERNRIARYLEENTKESKGGDYYNSKPVQVSKRFARQLIASTLEGRTTYTDAFRLLNVKKSKNFDGLGQKLGVV